MSTGDPYPYPQPWLVDDIQNQQNTNLLRHQALQQKLIQQQASMTVIVGTPHRYAPHSMNPKKAEDMLKIDLNIDLNEVTIHYTTDKNQKANFVNQILNKWCEDNCKGIYSVEYNGDGYTGLFENIEDAAGFRLRWA